MNDPHINSLANSPGLSGRVILVHGFNVSDGGAGTTDRFRAHYEREGFEVIEFDTHWQRGILRDLFSVRFDNVKRAQKLARLVHPGDVLVGHSNGCTIIHLMTWLIASLSCDAVTKQMLCSLILIYHNPALDADAPAALNVKGRYVFHSASDGVVHLASLLYRSNWGRMGQIGYVETDYEKIDGVTQNISYDHLGIFGAHHSAAFAQAENYGAMFIYHSLFIQSCAN